ncbi:uncharacterized protein PAC_16388 [Phialocephala subalpina]|uniref:T6SS Phospholipase effector Tle1-like catalytic domain-containing protein n=1 Tax=Phialocephala subalpina TaxID=576137 RepID=A0A1L7XNG2_9HELO|nr:uncharacterized protein PAC_16388 [Phialocephala subalpina]
MTDSKPPQLPRTIRAVKDSHSACQGRTLVICLDGTGDSFDNDNSNVVNFVACLKKDDPNQITYYQSGIGTYNSGGGLKSGFSAAIDMSVGSGLGIHIRDAYAFLMQNYREGDRICLLGFSRGAYTVRCLAGMLHKVGLLPANNRQQISFAYRFYKDDSKEGWKMSAEFKRTFCTNVNVYFVGVWDCVASVGFIPRKLPFSRSATNAIGYFRHAMALDEHRAKFKVCRWTPQRLGDYGRDDPSEFGKDKTEDKTPKAESKSFFHKVCRPFSKTSDNDKNKQGGNGNGSKNGKERRGSAHSIDTLVPSVLKTKDKEEQARLEAVFDKYDRAVHTPCKTDAVEVWFMGAHADVGGGAVANEERHMLSRIPLRWMIRQTFECNTGILFSTSALAETGLDVPTLWPIYKTPNKPLCGPSPRTLELFESNSLPPLQRRSTAIGIDEFSYHKRLEQQLNSTTSYHESQSEIHSSPSSPGTLVHPQRALTWNGEFEKEWDGGIKKGKDGKWEIEMLPEQVEDHFDSLAGINDQLVLAKGWWILEFWPVKIRVLKEKSRNHDENGGVNGGGGNGQGEEKVWEKKVGMNLGKYRAVMEEEPMMHWTVEMRIHEGAYKIKNRTDGESVWSAVA